MKHTFLWALRVVPTKESSLPQGEVMPGKLPLTVIHFLCLILTLCVNLMKELLREIVCTQNSVMTE